MAIPGEPLGHAGPDPSANGAPRPAGPWIGRSAVVTGAASGIGRAVAHRVLGAGARLIAVDRDAEGLRDLEARGATIVVADLSLAAELATVIEVGTGADYLVNVAGILHPQPLLEVEPDDLRRVFAVNLDAPWMLCSRIGAAMPAGGAIVNVSSAAAKNAKSTEIAAYAASKAAVLSMTRSFAAAYAARGVRVNAVCPGIIDTPMQQHLVAHVAASIGRPVDSLEQERLGSVPLGRAGSPVECAAVIAFLLSADSSYMTGQAINISGGMVTW
jgi:NAD(P)-dependent dehydrogenase (short-subunit alcohol dehydrogenase family)